MRTVFLSSFIQINIMVVVGLDDHEIENSEKKVFFL